jgi:hypothetical protein
MNSAIYFHTQHNINCAKIINKIIKGDKYIKYYNKFLIPYQCKIIDQQHNTIIGNFLYPMWNVLERSVLSSGPSFDYSYIKGNNYMIGINTSKLTKYNILGQSLVYGNELKAYKQTLFPNSILFFSIEKEIAEPLIKNGLL